jgi:hypothetical protein
MLSKILMFVLLLFFSWEVSALPQDYKNEISELVKQYGQKYKDGYEVLEKGCHITITATPEQFLLDITMLNPTQLFLELTLQRTGRPEMQKSSFTYPDFPPLKDVQLNQVDEIFKKYKQIFVLTELNQMLVKYDLTQGYQGLAKQKMTFFSNRERSSEASRIHHYFNPPYAVLFYEEDSNPNFFSGPFALWINLETEQIEGANWMSYPLKTEGMLSDEEFTFIDNALKKNGNFGAYGSVASGLDTLIENSEITIQNNEKEYFINISPINGYGHTTIFSIIKESGEITAPLTMHMIPQDPLDFDQ